jgi:uncharacterized protein YhaN
MPELQAKSEQNVMSLNGTGLSDLESRIRQFFDAQQRLRALLDQARAELDQVNAALMRFQDEYCTDAAREEEYLSCVEQILGCSVRLDPNELAAALADPQSTEEFLAELEKIGQERVGSANA